MPIITSLPSPEFVTIEEMNASISFCNKEHYDWMVGEFDYTTKRDPRFAYIIETRCYIKLCYLGKNPNKKEQAKKSWKWLYKILPRDGVVSYPGYADYARGACSSFRRVTAGLIPDFTGEEWYEKSINHASPLLWYDDEYNLRKIKIYEYDMNSAYGWGLKNAPLPDTRFPLGFGELKKGQVGFTWKGSLGFIGQECCWRFPILDRDDRKPIDNYVDTWYQKKSTAKTDTEREKSKAYIVVPIGNFQRYNWFMRSAVVEWVNNYITDLADKYDCVVKYNTDAIISLERIPELDSQLGHGLGQWKLEKEGTLKYNMHNEQWYDDYGKTIETKIRGVRKSAIGEDFDIELGNYQDSIKYFLEYDIYHVRRVVDINEELKKSLL